MESEMMVRNTSHSGLEGKELVPGILAPEQTAQ